MKRKEQNAWLRRMLKLFGLLEPDKRLTCGHPPERRSKKLYGWTSEIGKYMPIAEMPTKSMGHKGAWKMCFVHNAQVFTGFSYTKCFKCGEYLTTLERWEDGNYIPYAMY